MTVELTVRPDDAVVVQVMQVDKEQFREIARKLDLKVNRYERKPKLPPFETAQWSLGKLVINFFT